MRTPVNEMRDQIVILTPTTGKDASGGETTTYVPGNPLWVALRPTSTREAVQFGQIDAEVTHVLHGHWHELNAISAKARIRRVEDSVEFDIVGLPLNDPKRAFTRLNVKQREND